MVKSLGIVIDNVQICDKIKMYLYMMSYTEKYSKAPT